ncbi:quinone-dependent dihydroorotate dehydrogenase [Reichenbachiella sp. MALMAid0571]|uniref:quinone-dependent dihydroorotate dehydrogenase n=1 Tax=Reichenbachiella sp. MALMAid0571 TaxID=3143939 RepID=UPI0032DFC9D1
MYKSVIRPFLFLMAPEQAHNFTFSILKMVKAVPGLRQLIQLFSDYQHPSLERELFGLKIKNPVGLAAGLDKNAEAIDVMSSFGFGFIEIGTVTPKPQGGNPKPRMFRLPKDKSLINRMGFNNDGVVTIKNRLTKRKSKVLVGGNIGKNKLTPNENAIDDYLICFNELFDQVDYFVVNVSSPNTPGLRELQEKEPLMKLLQTLMDENNKKHNPKPILLKIAPDLTNEQLDDIVEIVNETKISGVIATNTTIDRNNLLTDKQTVEDIGNGGLSGAVLAKRSTDVIRYLSERSNGKIPLIGVGGIASAEDVIEKLEAGASLVQVYSGLIYEGPGLVKKINKKLVQKYRN